MERPSRMSKYKDLREGIKTDVNATGSSNHDTVKELNSLSDTDFLREFPQVDDEETVSAVSLKSANKEDTLIEPLTLDTINSQVDEELQRALTRVREDAGQDDFNTRMDILNKIRQSQAASSLQESFEDDEEEEVDEYEVVEEDDEEEEEAAPSSHTRFGLFRRHKEDDEEEYEDEEEYVEYENEEDDDEYEEEDTSKHRFRFLKRHHDDEEEEDEDEATIRVSDSEDDEDVEHSKFVKVLNGIIIILVLILIGLLVYFASEFFL